MTDSRIEKLVQYCDPVPKVISTPWAKGVINLVEAAGLVICDPDADSEALQKVLEIYEKLSSEPWPAGGIALIGHDDLRRILTALSQVLDD